MTAVPPFLKPGDRVLVAAPASPLRRDQRADLEAGCAVLRTHFDVEVDATCHQRDFLFAGTDAQRSAAIERALSDPTIGAFVAARGGWGTWRALVHLRLPPDTAPPVWFVGSSDMTALLLHLWAARRWCAVHGPVAASLAGAHRADAETLCALLEGRTPPPVPLVSLYPGRASGPLIGGNLTVLVHMLAWLPPHFADGALLFLEDVGESPYKIDRALFALECAGVFTRAAGVVFGTFTRCDDGGPVSVEAVLRTWSQRIRRPCASGYPAAHGDRNAPFLHGGMARLEATEDIGRLIFLSQAQQ